MNVVLLLDSLFVFVFVVVSMSVSVSVSVVGLLVSATACAKNPLTCDGIKCVVDVDVDRLFVRSALSSLRVCVRWLRTALNLTCRFTANHHVVLVWIGEFIIGLFRKE